MINSLIQYNSNPNPNYNPDFDWGLQQLFNNTNENEATNGTNKHLNEIGVNKPVVNNPVVNETDVNKDNSTMVNKDEILKIIMEFIQ